MSWKNVGNANYICVVYVFYATHFYYVKLVRVCLEVILLIAFSRRRRIFEHNTIVT